MTDARLEMTNDHQDNCSPTARNEPESVRRDSARESRANERDLCSLLAQHRAGGDLSEAALERLVLRIHPPIRGYLRQQANAMGRDDEFLQEATQQSLVSIVFGLHGCRAINDAEFMGWVLSVARNQISDLLRREGPWSVSLDDELETVVVSEDFHASIGRCDDVEPGLDVLLQAVGRVSASLPADAAALLWMRLIGGFEWREVADAVGIAASAAKRRFQRLQRSLRAPVYEQLSTLPASDRASALDWLARRLGAASDA